MAHRGGYPGGPSTSPRGSSRSHSQPRGRGATGPSSKALVIKGSEGKYSLINGTYEPTGMHGSFPCWASRSTNPCYLFHTGKTRWVISKELDDGTTCYAFIQDDGVENPAKCKGPWTRCNDKGEWKQDPRVKCTETAISTNPFVKLRTSLDEEMRKVKIVEEKDRQLLWKTLDRNGDGNCELTEVETLVHDLCKSGVWPRWLNDEKALEKAYKRTLEESIDGDDKVEKEEFHCLLLNIFWFGKLHEVFQEIAADDDSIDVQEFTRGMEKLGIKLDQHAAEEEFRRFDSDNSGTINFVEFCARVREQVCPDTSDGRDESDSKKAQMTEMMEKNGGSEATSGAMVRKKHFADFDKLEKQLKTICSEPDMKGLKKMWRRVDFNGNNKVSLAEIDKWVVENYPLLNHKPALIRAQQATLHQFSDTDGFIEKKEFKGLLLNLFYYNKLFWLFDQADQIGTAADHDRRMDLKEFQWCLTMCGIKLSPTKAKAEFAKVDTNNGGFVLFDEFCQYFVDKQCPEAMTEFIADE